MSIQNVVLWNSMTEMFFMIIWKCGVNRHLNRKEKRFPPSKVMSKNVDERPFCKLLDWPKSIKFLHIPFGQNEWIDILWLVQQFWEHVFLCRNSINFFECCITFHKWSRCISILWYPCLGSNVWFYSCGHFNSQCTTFFRDDKIGFFIAFSHELIFTTSSAPFSDVTFHNLPNFY